jgi:protein-S-isoprenylcysteine O-methyltransferase Ste14
MFELIAFILLSILLLLFTLRRPYSHRFFRFFSFECAIGLVLWQAEPWFEDPISPTQLISWMFLAGSLFLALHALRQLKVYGAPRGDIEDTTRLVTEGVYRYIRHPLYGSLLLFGVGALFKRIDNVSFLLTCALFGFVVATSRVEEKANLNRFGEAYRRYMDQTKMLIPYIY